MRRKAVLAQHPQLTCAISPGAIVHPVYLSKIPDDLYSYVVAVMRNRRFFECAILNSRGRQIGWIYMAPGSERVELDWHFDFSEVAFIVLDVCLGETEFGHAILYVIG